MSKKLLKIGIAGCGAIGSSLAKTIVRDFQEAAELVALFDIDTKKSQDLSNLIGKTKRLSVESLQQLINKSELVIEASSAKSSCAIAQAVLSRRRDIMIMSVGGIVAELGTLSSLAKRYNAKVYVPSGAVAGIDALKAASVKNLKSIVLTTRKNPKSFKDVEYIRRKKINLDKIKRDTTLFFGSAKQAIKFFPQNINVAGTLCIAGLGEDKTKVKIVATPGIEKNIHEIEIKSEAANISTRTENILHPENPKTSYLAVLSAVATLKQILDPVKIGT